MEPENRDMISVEAMKEVLREMMAQPPKEHRPSWFTAIGLGVLGFILGAIITARPMVQQVQAARRSQASCVAQLNQIRAQITEHTVHSEGNPGEQLLLSAIGSILGLPPGVVNMAKTVMDNLPKQSPSSNPQTYPLSPSTPPVSPGILGTLSGNLSRSSEAAHAAAYVGQSRVIETFLKSCGDSANADCILSRMCPDRNAAMKVRAEAFACGNGFRCWRQVLHDCGNSFFADIRPTDVCSAVPDLRECGTQGVPTQQTTDAQPFAKWIEEHCDWRSGEVNNCHDSSCLMNLVRECRQEGAQ